MSRGFQPNDWIIRKKNFVNENLLVPGKRDQLMEVIEAGKVYRGSTGVLQQLKLADGKMVIVPIYLHRLATASEIKKYRLEQLFSN